MFKKEVRLCTKSFFNLGLILAIADVLLSSEKRINNDLDWYFHPPETGDDGAIKKHYRRLTFLPHPEKNKYPFVDQDFKEGGIVRRRRSKQEIWFPDSGGTMAVTTTSKKLKVSLYEHPWTTPWYGMVLCPFPVKALTTRVSTVSLEFKVSLEFNHCGSMKILCFGVFVGAQI
ncbi:hypothetical protein Tsubulata_010920 [Turnera subulata]|uniref:J domain-containing protein n=1 Tax=Turnera subulata TaxID=218843 RepID=A0A9Q0F418_9ROSI|nr:hypothetical protein Tsubulata_010920 [Turnera subulata]